MKPTDVVKLEKELQKLRPSDRCFHMIAFWPYKFEHDNKPVKCAFWPQSIVQDIFGTRGKK